MNKGLVPFITILVLLLASGTSCQSFRNRPKRSTFLRTADPTWNQWLDQKVDLEINRLPLWKLHELQAFSGIRYRLEGQTAGGVLITLNVENLSRRDILWKIHKDSGLLIDFQYAQGVKMLRFRSQKMADLTGG